MKVQCPECTATGNIDESKVPPEGRDVTCPRCKHRFLVLPERSCVEIIQKREMMRCPKCGIEQPLATNCAECGVVVQKYIQAAAKSREREWLETTKLKSDLRHTEAWYSDLFDRRLASLLVRVLSLLVLVVVMMNCSMNSARRNRMEAVNQAEMKRAEEGPNKPKPSPSDDWTVLADLYTCELHLRDAAYNCLRQCDLYSMAWYSGNEQEARYGQQHVLDGTMTENLKLIEQERLVVERESHLMKAPSAQYLPYYDRVRRLHAHYDVVYKYAREYRTNYVGFPDTRSRVSNDLQAAIAELDQLRPKQLTQ